MSADSKPNIFPIIATADPKLLPIRGSVQARVRPFFAARINDSIGGIRQRIIMIVAGPPRMGGPISPVAS